VPEILRSFTSRTASHNSSLANFGATGVGVALTLVRLDNLRGELVVALVTVGEIVGEIVRVLPFCASTGKLVKQTNNDNESKTDDNLFTSTSAAIVIFFMYNLIKNLF